MAIRIGISPLTWSNDDMPELGASIPLEVCLAEGRQAGFAGFELGRKFPRDASLLSPILRRHSLALVSGWYGSQLLRCDLDTEIASVTKHMELLKTMSCQVMVFADVSGAIHQQRDVPLSKRPVMTPAEWKTLTNRLTGMADYLADNGLRMAYHHHMGTIVETEEDIDRLMAATGPAVGLLLDTGHLAYAGVDPLTVLQRHGRRVAHVHCKDVRLSILASAKDNDSSFLNAVLNGVFTVPGDGDLDFLRLARELKRLDYAGWLVVEAEQDPAIANPLEFATKGHQHLQQVADASGLC